MGRITSKMWDLNLLKLVSFLPVFVAITLDIPETANGLDKKQVAL
jgi:hypothetical protein